MVFAIVPATGCRSGFNTCTVDASRLSPLPPGSSTCTVTVNGWVTVEFTAEETAGETTEETTEEEDAEGDAEKDDLLSTLASALNLDASSPVMSAVLALAAKNKVEAKATA